MKKTLAALSILVSVCAFADESVQTKGLRVGDATIEALGQGDQDNVYTSLRIVRCVDDLQKALAEEYPGPLGAPFLKAALFLTPGSTIVLRRKEINEKYAIEFSTRDLVRITCTR